MPVLASQATPRQRNAPQYATPRIWRARIPYAFHAQGRKDRDTLAGLPTACYFYFAMACLFFRRPPNNPQRPWLVFSQVQITSHGHGLFFRPNKKQAMASGRRGWPELPWLVFFAARPGQGHGLFFSQPGLARGHGLFFSQPGAGQGPWLVFFRSRAWAGWPAKFLKEMDGLAGN